VQEFTTQVAQCRQYDFIVVAVTGHGAEDGIPIPGQPSVNPTQILNAARSCPGIKGGAIVLAQCFAGIFNYTDAAGGSVPLSLVGATSLNPSLSSPLVLPAALKQSDGSDGFNEWTANIFMARFFEWMASPRDVDGDGRCTLMDAYRYASVHCNQDLRARKGVVHASVTQDEDRLSKFERLPPTTPGQMLLLGLRKAALRRKIQDALEVLYLHQEPWVLNARFAGNIEF
jgi:hypothetical protein